MTKGRMKKIGEMARDHGFNDFKWIQPKEIVTGYWVRAKCQYGCPSYGRKACCPPQVPPVGDCQILFEEYQKGLLLHRAKKILDPQMRVAWNQEIYKNALAFERDVFLLGFHKAFIFTPSPCSLCGECKSQKSECGSPSLARPTPEAYCVDVYATARKFGYPIQVIRGYGEEVNRYGVLLLE